MDITTKSSTKVKAEKESFGLGKRGRRDRVISMTTPPQHNFHQKKNDSQDTNLNRRTSSCRKLPSSAFTLVELMGVIVVIGILAGLTLGGAGAVRRHGAVSQAKAEIAALQAACERYFADYNQYPSNTAANPTSSFNPTLYNNAGATLFSALFGTNQFNRAPRGKRYFEPKPSMVSSTNGVNPYFQDPWGYAYGYNSDGTNPPLVWSTAGQTTGGANTNKWITSWPKM